MHDLHHAFRQLAKSPGFTVTAAALPARRTTRIDPTAALRAE